MNNIYITEIEGRLNVAKRDNSRLQAEIEVLEELLGSFKAIEQHGIDVKNDKLKINLYDKYVVNSIIKSTECKDMDKLTLDELKAENLAAENSILADVIFQEERPAHQCYTSTKEDEEDE